MRVLDLNHLGLSLLFSLTCLVHWSTAEWVPTSLSRMVALSGDSPRASSQVTIEHRPSEQLSQEHTFRLAVPNSIHGNLSALHAGLGKGTDQTKLSVDLLHHDIKLAATVYEVTLPADTSSPATLTLTEAYSHIAVPYPRALKQVDSDAQYMLYSEDLLGGLATLHPVQEAKVRVKLPTPRVKAIEAPENFDASHSTGAATIVFTSKPGSVQGPQVASVQYFQPEPVSGFKSLLRQIKVSHWSNTVDVHEEIELVNNGPKLKGHFARIEHQLRAYTRRGATNTSPSVLSGLSIPLPPHSHSPYFVDTVGNVSTSHFRSSSAGAGSSSPALLELKPRYPLLGGWTYNFTMGYSTPKEDFVTYDAHTGEYELSIPFLSALPGVPVDEAEVHILVPEGASITSVHLPQKDIQLERTTTHTYFDTTGHPTLILRRNACQDVHNQPVVVRYRYSTLAHMQKPLAMIGVASLFTLVFTVYSSIDWSISQSSAKSKAKKTA